MPAAQVMCAGSSRANAGHLEQRSPGSLNAQHINDVDDMVADGARIVNPWVTHHLHGQHMLSHVAWHAKPLPCGLSHGSHAYPTQRQAQAGVSKGAMQMHDTAQPPPHYLLAG